jgi:hypothetical protein
MAVINGQDKGDQDILIVGVCSFVATASPTPLAIALHEYDSKKRR